MFLLVPAHPGCPGQSPESHVYCVRVVVCVCGCTADDVGEMYCKLRRLVLEYLCIPPTPTTKQSSAVDLDDDVAASCAGGLPCATRRALLSQSAPLPARRSWSRPSITDSCELVRSNVPAAVQTGSPPPARSTVVSD